MIMPYMLCMLPIQPAPHSHPACRLLQPLRVPAEDRFWGCFSWVPLPPPAAAAEQQGREHLLAAAVPVLTDAEFEARQQECRKQLAQVEVQELQLAF